MRPQPGLTASTDHLLPLSFKEYNLAQNQSLLFYSRRVAIPLPYQPLEGFAGNNVADWLKSPPRVIISWGKKYPGVYEESFGVFYLL